MRRCVLVIAWLLGIFGSTPAVSSVERERLALQARVAAAREQINAAMQTIADRSAIGGKLTDLTQWLNWPNWGNWNNWPNYRR